MASPSTVYTLDEVAKHNKEGDVWVIVDGKVYDLSRFGALHPGGLPPLLDPAVAGKDATELFYELHRASILQEKRYAKLVIGTVAPAPSGDAAKKPVKGKSTDIPTVLPWAEAFGTWRRHSPYYKETHHKFRAALREFLDREIKPHSRGWDDRGEYPTRDVDKALGDAGIFACMVAADKSATQVIHECGITLPGGVKPEEFDYFHGMIMAEELRRGTDGCYGVTDGLVGGVSIGLPPLLKFGTPELIKKFAVPCIRGERRICLAISEPYAGSDVAKIRCTATPVPSGGWTVSGVKKWITGGMVADYFTTLVRSNQGPLMLVVERDERDAVTTTPIKTSYSPAAATAYVSIHNAAVPAENLIGMPGMGFHLTMANFNFERWSMICCGNYHSRMVLEESLKWAASRKVFGKALIQQPVIRFKLAAMAAEVESVHSMLEDLTYQMCQMTPKDINKHLAAPIALLKYKQTRAASVVSDNAVQIWGGRGITSSGMGYVIEKFQKSFKFAAILGGSEEILADFAIRQSMRKVPPLLSRL